MKKCNKLLFLSALLALSLTACGKSEASQISSDSKSESQPQSQSISVSSSQVASESSVEPSEPITSSIESSIESTSSEEVSSELEPSSIESSSSEEESSELEPSSVESSIESTSSEEESSEPEVITSSEEEPESTTEPQSESSEPESSSEPSSEQPPVNDTVSVFVLSGQSNMEGSTYWIHPNGTPLLENYFEEEGLDFTPVTEGIENVVTSYYGFYYPNKWGNAHSNSLDQSSNEGKMEPNFEPTRVGMGVGDSVQGQRDIFFGPELGLANTLADYVEQDPVHLIKCAFSGSGFTKTDGPNWTSRDEDPDKSLFYLLKTYTYNCLQAIEDSGLTPVIKGFLWHQGESDGGDNNYETYTRTLISDFREEFADYAPDYDGENIAFIDCTIYDGKGTSRLSYGTAANNAKMKIGNESDDDLNFCIDASHDEGGLGLEIGDDSKGGYNTYHYNTKDAYLLGQAYADVIIDNGLLYN